MTEPTELLPCPFCGSNAVASISKSESLWSHDIVDWTRVHCTNDDCNAQTEPTCDGYEPSAIEVWNRRTPQPTKAQAGAVPQHQPTPDVQAKMAVNQWDHFGDILPTLKAISRGDWYWGANSRCKYIEIRLDTRDGGCLLFDRERVRISPAQFSHQSHSVRMEPWPGIKGADHG